MPLAFGDQDLTELISNNAVAALLIVAISVAQAMDLDARPLVVAVIKLLVLAFNPLVIKLILIFMELVGTNL